MTTPDISIVVCTRNRAALLYGALASLYDLATEDEFTYEIVVVDNGSTDETSQVIAAAIPEAKHPLRGVRENEPGVVAARNRGIRESQGRWIAFFDDDQLADWHWLAELLRGASDKGCRVVGGSVQLALPADCNRQLHPAVQMLLGETLGSDLPQRFGGRLTPGGGNLMIERGVFDQVGRFENSIEGRGEDVDLYARIEQAQIDAWYIPTAIVHHLTASERLAPDYLLKLAQLMGQATARRQRAALGRMRFTGRWLTRFARLATVEYPSWLWARLRRNDELALGRHCELAITRGFLQGASPTPAPAQPIRRPAAESTAKPGELAPRRPAPVFILRSGEPTMVMDFPQLAIGPASSKLPSH